MTGKNPTVASSSLVPVRFLIFPYETLLVCIYVYIIVYTVYIYIHTSEGKLNTGDVPFSTRLEPSRTMLEPCFWMMRDLAPTGWLVASASRLKPCYGYDPIAFATLDKFKLRSLAHMGLSNKGGFDHIPPRQGNCLGLCFSQIHLGMKGKPMEAPKSLYREGTLKLTNCIHVPIYLVIPGASFFLLTSQARTEMTTATPFLIIYHPIICLFRMQLKNRMSEKKNTHSYIYIYIYNIYIYTLPRNCLVFQCTIFGVKPWPPSRTACPTGCSEVNASRASPLLPLPRASASSWAGARAANIQAIQTWMGVVGSCGVLLGNKNGHMSHISHYRV